MIVAITTRDLKLAMRRQADIVSVLFFFIIVASLFPLGIGPEPQLLKKLAPGVLWVGALLATMLSLPRLFADDYRDGTLEQLVLAPQPLGLTVIGKGHCALAGLRTATGTVGAGTRDPVRSGDGCTVHPDRLAADRHAGTLRHRRNRCGTDASACAAAAYWCRCWCCPLYIPVLIFGAGAVGRHRHRHGAEAHLSILGALAIAGFFAPWATAAALRISLE